MKMQNDLIFKKATEDDVDLFVSLEETAAPNKTYSAITDKQEALDEIKNNEVYLIYKGAQLVGSTEYAWKSPDHAYLGGLVIHPGFQGQGIGRAAALFRLEKIKDAKRVDLVTHPENFKIQNLYKSLGFVIEKQIENYFGDGEPRVVMALNR